MRRWSNGMFSTRGKNTLNDCALPRRLSGFEQARCKTTLESPGRRIFTIVQGVDRATNVMSLSVRRILSHVLQQYEKHGVYGDACDECERLSFFTGRQGFLYDDKEQDSYCEVEDDCLYYGCVEG